jgi:hypothetical protein
MTRLPAPGLIAAALYALLATPNAALQTASRDEPSARHSPVALNPRASTAEVAPRGKPGARPPSSEPEWWDIALTIEVKGEYRMEVRDTRALGTFAFAFAWSGTMQKDDEDFLLVHRACELTRWNIEEKTSFAEAITTLMTADIMDKPELKVNYILKKADGLHLNFEIAGFDVPKLASAESFYLRLPVSEENAGPPAGPDYNLFVKSGSNKIIIDEKPIEQGCLTKKFAWSWRYQNWIQKLDSTVFQSSGHEAAMTLSITPRKEVKGRAFAAEVKGQACGSPLARGM